MARSRQPLKADLLAAQEAVGELLQRVIGDGETVTVVDDGRAVKGIPVAVMMPYAAYRSLMEASDAFIDLADAEGER